jgi:plastocyanin
MSLCWLTGSKYKESCMGQHAGSIIKRNGRLLNQHPRCCFFWYLVNVAIFTKTNKRLTMKTFFTLTFAILAATLSFAKTWNVAANGTNTFSPATLTINKGDIVTWTSEGTHNVKSGTSCTPDAKFTSATLSTGNTFSFTFSNAGTFPYFCSFHCSMGMTGVITVSATNGIETASSFQNIYKVFPNPFAGSTNIGYTLTRASEVKIDVTSITGQKVLGLALNQVPGQYNQELDLSHLSKGVYVLLMRLDGIPAKETLLIKE